MRIKSLTIKNVKSFKNEIKINFDDFNILMRPNGGGKSNLFDIITFTLRNFLIYRYNFEESNPVTASQKNIHSPISQIKKELEKFTGEEGDSIINIQLQITKQDIENVRIWIENKHEFQSILDSFYNKPFANFETFLFMKSEYKLELDKEINFKIKNNELIPPDSKSCEFVYLQYLNHFEFFFILSKQKVIKDINLEYIYLYFSPYRGGETQDKFQANLSSDDIYKLIRDYYDSTSKNAASLIKIASFYFADKKRKYEASSDKSDDLWNDDDSVKIVTKYFKKLGYSWKLNLIDYNKNIYEILLIKGNVQFSIGQASSGEKEIINFILGILVFNIKDSLIIVDEPELHLHPKWQSMLIELFNDLSLTTHNQFILSTHSAIFINENTISNIIRIYREENTSNFINIDKDNLQNAKDLLHIINSHNNEKMFFADKVVLVEGITDRLIFEKIIEVYSELFVQIPEIIHILEVQGKSNLTKYREFLKLIRVKNYIVADNDYILTICDNDIKKLFTTDDKKLDQAIIHKKSKDAKGLDSAITEGDIKEIRQLWEYIKSRKKKLKELNPDEQAKLDEFFERKMQEDIYILKKGEIEDYLQDGYKELDKVIELVKNIKLLLKTIKSDEREEINKIVFKILEIQHPGEEAIKKRLTEYGSTT